MPALHGLRPFARTALAALLVLGAWWLAFPRASMPPVSPLGDQLVYSAVDPAPLVLLEPVLHAPWLGETQAWGRLLAVLAAAVGATGVAIFAGAGTLATLFVVAALFVDASFGAALSHVSGLAVAVGLVWLAAGAAFDEHQRVSPARPWFNPLAAILLWGAAVWWDWIAIVTWPIVFAALRRTPRRPARGVWTAASLAVGGVAFAAHFHWMADIARTHAFAPDTILTVWETLAVAFDSRPWMPAGSYVAADLTTGVSYLGVGLAALGLAFAGIERWWRRAVTLSAVLMAAVIAGWPEWQAEALRFGAWALTPLGAVGLTWLSQQVAREGLAGLATMAIGTVLVAETVVMGARPLMGRDARGFRDALERALDAALDEPVVIVAEDTRLDSAVTAWAAHRQGTRRTVQEGRVVSAAFGEGRTVLAGPVGRRQLELAGFVFERRFTIADPLPFVMSAAVSAFRCTSVRSDRWSQLPGLEYTGRLGIELPAAIDGELQIIVGDTLPLRLRVESADGGAVPTVSESLLSGPGVGAPPPDYWFDGGLPEDGPHVISRLHLPMHPTRASLVALQLGRRAPRVIARLSGVDDEARGRICAAPIGRETLFADTDTERISVNDAHVFGRGWYGVQHRGGTAFRWADADAVMLLPSAATTDVEVSIDADADTDDRAADAAEGDTRAADADTKAVDAADGADRTDERRGTTAGARPTGADAITLTLRVNGIDVGTRRMSAGERRYTWSVSARVWLAGTNELWWHTSRAVRPADTGGTDTRRLAIRVKAIEVSR